MSPPQVNLAAKEPPTVSDEELPMEKKDEKETPIIVTVETEKIRIQRFKVQAKKRRRVVCCVALIAVVLVAAASAIALGVRHHRRHGHHDRHHRRHDRDHWRCDYGREHINENVQIDHQNQLIHVHHDQGSNNQPALHILHEYGRRMAAYKNVDRNICYITRLDETFEEGYERWESYEFTGRDPKTLHVLTNQHVETLVLRHVTDIHIYALCRNSASYWAVEIEEKDVTMYMTTVKV